MHVDFITKVTSLEDRRETNILFSFLENKSVTASVGKAELKHLCKTFKLKKVSSFYTADLVKAVVYKTIPLTIQPLYNASKMFN